MHIAGNSGSSLENENLKLSYSILLFCTYIHMWDMDKGDVYNSCTYILVYLQKGHHLYNQVYG